MLWYFLILFEIPLRQFIIYILKSLIFRIKTFLSFFKKTEKGTSIISKAFCIYILRKLHNNFHFQLAPSVSKLIWKIIYSNILFKKNYIVLLDLCMIYIKKKNYQNFYLIDYIIILGMHFDLVPLLLRFWSTSNCIFKQLCITSLLCFKDNL